MVYIKRFLEWIGLKEKINNTNHNPPLFREGEIWWCYIGENIGIELNGKGEKFTRPVLVFRKYDKNSFLGLPLSTKMKYGSWYVPIHFLGIDQIVVLVQGRVFDFRRFKEKMGELDKTQLTKTKKAYADLHYAFPNIDLPHEGGSRG